MPLTPRSIRFVVILSFGGLACSHSSSNSDSAAAGGDVASANAAPVVRGTISQVSPTSVVVTTDTGAVTVAMTSSPKVYDREPGSLADVTDHTFVGVTSVKQPDGKEQATEIHVFPDDLRGLGEGSRMMTPTAAPAGSRMTNGNVQSRMTNGTAQPSRMSNGIVSGANGGTIVVNYAGGSQTIDVPASTPVTDIKATSHQLAAGDQVYVVSKRGNDGSLTATAVMLVGK